ncbi:hypothetical protein NFI96_006596, partial [Prochilodus magdalenae]
MSILCPLLSQEATQLLVQSLVISRLDYCNLLLAGLPLRAIRPLQLVQNAAARLIFNLPKFTHVTPLLRSLHWLPVAARSGMSTELGLPGMSTELGLPGMSAELGLPGMSAELGLPGMSAGLGLP